MFAIGIICIIASALMFKMGLGSLKDSNNHAEYGVESASLQKCFCWVFIIIAAALAIGGGTILAG
jgi:hypothetical protein